MRSFQLAIVWFSGVGIGVGIGTIAFDQKNLAIADPTTPRQVSQQPASPQSGTQIQLNGRTIAAPWAQWQGRIGISDAGLVKTLGIQLLNTTSAAAQPVQWFTPANQPAPNLPTRLTKTLRYLDITNFAQQLGWQVNAIGSTLQIATPAARVLGVRQSKQTWGDRLVIELDRPTPWQSDSSTQTLLLSVDAQIDPPTIGQFKAIAGSFIQTVNLEPGANQTQIRVNFSSAVGTRVWSLSAPNRIVVDLRPDALVEQNILWANGLRWRQQIFPLGNNRIPVIWLEATPNANLMLQPIVPNLTSMTGTASLAQTAQQAQVAGAINAGFFNRDRQLPLGAIRRDGRWLSGPILNRGAIAWNPTGTVRFDRLTLQETLITPAGQRFSITHLNSGYLQAGIARYTTDWGSIYTSLSDGEIVVFVQNDRVTGQQALEKAGTPIQIPADGYLLVLRSNRSVAATFSTGTLLRLESITNPPDFNTFPSIIGAGPLLIQKRQIVLDAKAESFSNAFAVQTAARSAIAQTADGTLLLVTAHTRLDGAGLSLLEMAQLLQQMGAIAALNLDGGSSTTLYLGGQLLDRSPRAAARIHNGIGILLQPGNW